MTKVNADHSPSLHVEHEIGEVAVPDAEDPVADAQQGMRADKVGAQGQEGLGTVAHLQEGSPAMSDTGDEE